LQTWKANGLITLMFTENYIRACSHERGIKPLAYNKKGLRYRSPYNSILPWLLKPEADTKFADKTAAKTKPSGVPKRDP
jgi:hypothetical protein